MTVPTYLWPDKLGALLAKVKREIAGAWFRGEKEVTVTVRLR